MKSLQEAANKLCLEHMPELQKELMRCCLSRPDATVNAALHSHVLVPLTRSGGQDRVRSSSGGGGLLCSRMGAYALTVSGDGRATLRSAAPWLAHTWDSWERDVKPVAEEYLAQAPALCGRLADHVQEQLALAAQDEGMTLEAVTLGVEVQLELRSSALYSSMLEESMGEPVESVQRSPRIFFALRGDCRLTGAGRKLSGKYSAYWADCGMADAGAAARKAVKSAACHGTASRVQAGPYDLVFSPGIGAVLIHEICGHLIEHDQMLLSPLVTRVGEP